MSPRRLTYSADLKREVVRRVTESNENFRAVERELHLSKGIISSWVRSAEKEQMDAFRGHGHRTTDEEELRMLKQRNRELEQEVAILKRAVGILSQPPANGSR